ncbi:hypothetical protein FLONG3_5587 [Fusarium longipes]|uniref:Uncharacterized protein n=1 Tax=Fusarium longipes TaxID=694270 RepID=A0A395STK8_9HYPO|nr:hypothetical protein FLONG3_5587 [Fusarium longipes]
MFMRNVFVAAVSLQALVEGVVAQDKVTLTKYVTKAKAKPTAEANNNNHLYPVPDLPEPEPEVTVVPTSYVTDGTTIFVDETVTIPCSRCTASTAGNADAEATSEAEVISTVITSETGEVSDQTAEVTVIPTSYITDGTTIFVDETVTIPCTKCAGGKKTKTEAGAEETSEAAVETEVTTGGDALAQGTSSEAAASETLSTDVAEATETGDVPAQTAEVTVIPTSYITDGTTIFVDETVTIPCTKCAGGKKTETVPAGGAEETTTGADFEGSSALGVATSEVPEETTVATGGAAESTPVENDTQTANTATGEADASTEAEIPIPTTIIPSVILTTGNSQNTVTSQPGPFANTTVTAPAIADTTAVEELPASSEVATSSAVVSKIVKPVIVVIREVTIFHRTVVIGAACPPVKRGTKGDFVVGSGSEEQSFTKIVEALDDACGKQAKACAESAGKNYAVTDCEKQLEICRADASSTAKAPTGDLKESTETASIILPSDAAVTTGKDNKPAIGGHVVISTRTLTVSESCAISDGTPVIETPASTDASATTVQTADAEITSDADFEASTALGVATSDVPEVPEESSAVVSTLTLTKPNGEISITSMYITPGVPTGTGVTVPAEETTAEAPAETTEAAFETTSAADFEASTALGVATSEVPEVPEESTGVVTTLTLTKPNGDVSTTALTLTNGVPTGTGTAVYPGNTETKVVSDAETSEAPVETMPAVETSPAAEVSSALGVETSEEATTVVTGTQTGVVVITMTKPNGEISVTSMTMTPGIPTGTGTAVVTVPAEQTTAEAPAETSEAAIETTIVPGGQETTVVGDKTITHTVTNQITSYVTVGVDTVTEGTETITKTLTNEITQTVTVPQEQVTKTVTLDCGEQGAEVVTSVVTLPCEAQQTANVITSVVTMCPAPTTMATSSTKEPETVYVTATVEAQAQKPSAYPVPARFRRMLGL